MSIARFFQNKPWELVNCRLCRRITVIVCLSILAVEIAILVPSYLRLRTDLYERLETDGLRTISFVLKGLDRHLPDELLKTPVVDSLESSFKGVTLYAGSEPVASFGEMPLLAPSGVAHQRDELGAPGGSRYHETLWDAETYGLPFTVVARMDTRGVEEELVAFVFRVGGLVLIITVFVSAVTVAVLGVLVLSPLLRIRENLLKAREDPTNAERYKLPISQNDEIGETVTTINSLLERLSEARRVDIQEREQRLKDFVDASSDWFWEMDEDLRFSYFSDRFTEVTGVPHAALLGKTREETGIPDVDPQAWQSHLADLAARRSFRDFRHPRTWPDSRVTQIAINGKAVFDHAGTFKGYRGTGRDITEQKRAEDALRQTQQELVRKERLASLGQLTGTVSHELRNPLAAIRNSIFMIGEKTRGGDLGLDRVLARTERSISRCDRIVSELLDYTRTNTLEEKSEVLDSWLERVLGEQKMSSAITLRKELKVPGLVLEFDPDRLRRAVINVFDNACQAMTEAAKSAAEGQELSLTVQTTSFEDRAQLRFIDTGPGMTPDVLNKIFEPLYSTKGFGVGLGMPIVKQIMEQHGGGIEVLSDPGHGTTVMLWLPIQRKQEEAA